MSPEQCEADPDLIDARSDVYSLGVILFELLTGEPPYDLSSIPIYEATRLIREQQPTRMTTITDGIAGDLETIVGKAMDKDWDRRYQSASELLQDIHRFIEDEPIHARRASMVYQLKLFTKRNRGVVATVMAIGIALVFATVVSVFSSIRASTAEQAAIADRDRAVAAEEAVVKERDRAISAEEEAKNALAVAEESQQKTQKAMEETREIFQMMISVAEFNRDLLALGAPRNAQGEELSVHDILIFATTEIDKRFGHEPNLEAPARKAIGTLLWEMGDLENARVELKRSVDLFSDIPGDTRHAELVQTSTVYANVLLELGEAEKAREIVVALIDKGIRVLGPNSLEVLNAKVLLAKITKFGLTLESSQEALELGREVMVAINQGAAVTREFELEVAIEFADLLMMRHAMGGASSETFPLMLESMELIEATLPSLEEEFGGLHPAAVEGRNVLATGYFFTGRIDKSVPLLRQLYEDTKKVFGHEHFKTGEVAASLGTFLFYTGNPDAELILNEGIEIYSSIVAEDHPNLILIKSTLSQHFVNIGRYVEAEKLLREIAAHRHSFSDDSALTIQINGSLAYALMMQGKFEEGEPLWQGCFDLILSGDLGERSEAARGMKFIKANSYVVNDHDDADKTVNEFIAWCVEDFGPNHPQVIVFSQVLCESYFSAGNPDRGIAILTNLFDQIREFEESDDEDLLNVLKAETRLAALCVDAEKSDKALEILNRIIPPLQEVWEPTYESMVETEALRALALSQKGRGDESVAIFTTIYNRLTDELEAESSTAQWLEVKRVNNLVSLQRWDEIDEIMKKRLGRRVNDSDLLLQMAEVIVKNGHEGYRERYLDLALKATGRALEILGEDDPEATYGHAMVYFAHGDYENALSWLAKTIAFAGEDHEDIEKYRKRLDEVTAIKNDEQEASKGSDL